MPLICSLEVGSFYTEASLKDVELAEPNSFELNQPQTSRQQFPYLLKLMCIPSYTCHAAMIYRHLLLLQCWKPIGSLSRIQTIFIPSLTYKSEQMILNTLRW